MISGLAALVLVPALDQLLKTVLRRALGGRAVRLAGAGELRLVESTVWLRRVVQASHRGLWAAWFLAAAGIIAAAVWLPGRGWAIGLLLGGSLSHAIETSIRGAVSDYICLRFWPAFDLADVALTAGTLGLLSGLVPLAQAAIR